MTRRVENPELAIRQGVATPLGAAINSLARGIGFEAESRPPLSAGFLETPTGVHAGLSHRRDGDEGRELRDRPAVQGRVVLVLFGPSRARQQAGSHTVILGTRSLAVAARIETQSLPSTRGLRGH